MGERNSAFYYRNGTNNKAEPADEPIRRSDRQGKPSGKPNIEMKTTEAKSGSVLTVILLSVLAVVLLGSVIYSFNRRSTAYRKVSTMNNSLNLVEAENVRLQSELESKLTAKNVEDYAENVLGMNKIDSSQIEYIKIQTDDVVTIPEKEEGIFAKMKDFFNRCVEYFRG